MIVHPPTTHRPVLQLIIAVAALLFFCGCDQAPSPSALPSASGATAREGNGIIQGRVLLGGNPPPARVLVGSPGVPDESIVADSSHGLKNVIVYISNAPPSTRPADAPAMLDQIACQYVPHVLAVRTGQTLTLKSSDKMLHNVHLQSHANPDANYGFKAPSEKEIQLPRPEAPFKITCDVHPWMTAWLAVFDHPWFAVTSDDGKFTLTHVPPGQYTLIAWQEVLPQQEQIITVSDSAPADVKFVFPAP